MNNLEIFYQHPITTKNFLELTLKFEIDTSLGCLNMIGPSVKANQPDWMNIVRVIEETSNAGL